jgi:uncharacterized protein (UPF0332 family)
MNEEATGFWERSLKTLLSAKLLLQADSDNSASRSYYAAFYAVSALFALRGRTFTKHSAVETAVHRDLVRPGHWPKELGAHYSSLLRLRARADYGVLEHASEDEAKEAIKAVERILRAVNEVHPDVFSDPEGILQ